MNKFFDGLEGKPAPSLGGLTEWINTGDNAASSWDQYKGKVVILDYWATWCGPCRAGIPHLVELQKQYADKGVVVLGVHSSNGWEKMADFVAKEKLPYHFAADKDRKLGEALGVKFLPTYFVVDAQGNMFVAGANSDRLNEIVDALIKERDVKKTAANN